MTLRLLAPSLLLVVIVACSGTTGEAARDAAEDVGVDSRQSVVDSLDAQSADAVDTQTVDAIDTDTGADGQQSTVDSSDVPSADVAATDAAPADTATPAPWPDPRPAPAPPADPYPAWILLDGDVAAALRNVEAAAAAGVEAVQLSHGLVMAPEDVLEDPARLERLNTVADAAAAAGLEVLLWSHELEGDATYQVCFDPADPLWESRREAYRALLDAVPAADGIVLMFGSSQVEPWYAFCVCAWCQEHADPERAFAPLQTPPPAERVEQIVRLVADVVVGERGRRLVLRSFVHQPHELDAIGDGLELAADVALQPMSKDVPQDWQPYYPLNPLIGRFPDRGHVVELDAAGEYWGQSALPFAAVDYFHRRMLDALERGLAGYAARIERGNHSALGTPNEVNLYAVARLLADPSVAPRTLWADWIAERYGLAAESPENAALARILARTEVIARRTFYNLGFWALRKGSDPPSECRQAELLRARSNAKWDADPAWAALEADLLAPTSAVLASLAQEKHEGAVLAATNRAEFEDAVAGALDPADAADLRHRLALQEAAVQAWGDVTDVVWTYQLWRASEDPGHAAWLEAALRRLEGRAEALPRQVEGDLWPVSTANLAACAADVRGVFAPGVAPGDRPQPFLEPLALEPCAPDLCVTVTASEPVHLDLRFGWALPFPANVLDGPADPVTSHTFRVPPLPDGRWAVLRAEAEWPEGTLLGGDVWIWPAEAFAE